MRLLIIFLTSVATLNTYGQLGQLTTIEIPQLKSKGENQTDFVPDNWRILKSVNGKLNDDNITDYVMILGLKNEILHKNKIDTFRNVVPRLFVILLSEKQVLKLDIQSHKIILPSAFGGNFDPIEFNEPLTINEIDKSVTISMYGGLRERWTVDYTFKKRGPDWIMLTADTKVYDSSSNDEDVYNYSFDFTTKKVKDNKTGQKKQLNWDKKLKLRDFEPFENEVLPDFRL